MGLTGRTAGEGEDDDVIKGPGVVGVWRVERQLLHSLPPQVQQEGGVDHGNCVASQTVALTCGEVLGCAPVVTLTTNRKAGRIER